MGGCWGVRGWFELRMGCNPVAEYGFGAEMVYWTVQEVTGVVRTSGCCV